MMRFLIAFGLFLIIHLESIAQHAPDCCGKVRVLTQLLTKHYNNAVNKVNAVSNDMNKKRSQLLDNWNNVSAQFLDRHTPR